MHCTSLLLFVVGLNRRIPPFLCVLRQLNVLFIRGHFTGFSWATKTRWAASEMPPRALFAVHLFTNASEPVPKCQTHTHTHNQWNNNDNAQIVIISSRKDTNENSSSVNRAHESATKTPFKDVYTRTHTHQVESELSHESFIRQVTLEEKK